MRMNSSVNLLKMRLVFVLVQVSLCVCLKECTNTPTQLSSHTFRQQLLSSNNESLKNEMFSHYHLTPTDESAWMNLIPRKMLQEVDEFSWMMMYRKMKFLGVQKGFLNEVSLNDVRIDPNSMFGKAQQTNFEYLMMLDVDRLAWSFRKTAGLETPGEPYGGWEGPTEELRGHFVGHFLSASAQMWASTHNDSLKGKMDALVSALSSCQENMGTGYLSAFPSEFFDRFEAIQPVWAPYYTIHKILAGLLDQYTLAGNVQAFKMMKWMVDYFYKRVQSVILKYTIERHWRSLNEETGGMNDVLYRLFSITGDQKHLVLAHLFDKPCFLGVLAVKADDISGFHSNTHIPIVVGTQMRYEYTGDELYKDISTFFMDIMNSSHTYATGGTSSSEFWHDPKRIANFLSSETEESCTTYNMLKVSRNLFRYTKEISYADYYERALTNGVLSIQRGRDPGRMIYMLPLHPGGSKARSYHSWGSQFNDFWCCYGTGIESFSKLGDSIYFEEEGSDPGIYIIQYVSSSLNWMSGNVLLTQEVEPVVSWDPRLKVTITVSTKQKTEQFTINLRIPSWTNSNGVKTRLNNQDFSLPAAPGKSLVISRSWKSGDKINLEFPLTLRTEAIKDDRKEYSSIQAILYGPYLLAGLSMGDWDIEIGQPISPLNWITPIPADYNSNLISLTQDSKNTTMVLINSNNTIKMEKYPESGTDSAVAATYRLVTKSKKGRKYAARKQPAIGEEVMLEPFDLPGMFVVHQGEDEGLRVADSSDDNDSSGFLLVAGLDGKNGSVSLESASNKGCYIYNSDGNIKLSCNTKSSTSTTFMQGASFEMQPGISEYHPISFIAKGANRSFQLAPLLSLRDESYTVYFNIQS
ncbi:hypothetical protein Leryth_010921 [Lithospermum erythrorhizon]|nr:hypothetical protein Leryth_010921 [Lithospermum erythrorhizon]